MYRRAFVLLSISLSETKVRGSILVHLPSTDSPVIESAMGIVAHRASSDIYSGSVSLRSSRLHGI